MHCRYPFRRYFTHKTIIVDPAPEIIAQLKKAERLRQSKTILDKV